jgi:hypothetical protein
MASVGSSTSLSGSRTSVGAVVVVDSGEMTVVDVVFGGAEVVVLGVASIATSSRPHHPWIRIHYLSLAND